MKAVYLMTTEKNAFKHKNINTSYVYETNVKTEKYIRLILPSHVVEMK